MNAEVGYAGTMIDLPSEPNNISQNPNDSNGSQHNTLLQGASVKNTIMKRGGSRVVLLYLLLLSLLVSIIPANAVQKNVDIMDQASGCGSAGSMRRIPDIIIVGYVTTSYAPIIVPQQDSTGRHIKGINATFQQVNGQLKTTRLVPPGNYIFEAQANDWTSSTGTSMCTAGVRFSDGTFNEERGDSMVVYWGSIVYAPDTIKPEITAPDETITLTQAKTWVPMHNVTAKDDADGNLTSKVTSNPATRPTAMTTTPGQYKFTYTVKDKAGNTATKTRTITVIPDPLTAMPSTGFPVNRWMLVMILAVMAGVLSMVRLRWSDH